MSARRRSLAERVTSLVVAYPRVFLAVVAIWVIATMTRNPIAAAWSNFLAGLVGR